jgi:hypothetical protein
MILKVHDPKLAVRLLSFDVPSSTPNREDFFHRSWLKFKLCAFRVETKSIMIKLSYR